MADQRVFSERLEQMLASGIDGAIKVLDHGFVRLVDYMGGDSSIVQAARVSYGKGTKTVREDAGLINYLMRNSHTTPFEMCSLKLHIKLPIFVARQWIRHRTANVNEYSARYSEMSNEFYVPDIENISGQSESNKQGRGSPIEPTAAREIQELIRSTNDEAYKAYQQMLAMGVARELARTVLPVSIYTEWYWKIDLHNLLRFLRLRMDAHAQYEIREYANAIADIVQSWVPAAYDAFMRYQLDTVSITHNLLDAIVSCAVNKEPLTQEKSGLNKTEFTELKNKLGASPIFRTEDNTDQ